MEISFLLGWCVFHRSEAFCLCNELRGEASLLCAPAADHGDPGQPEANARASVRPLWMEGRGT